MYRMNIKIRSSTNCNAIATPNTPVKVTASERAEVLGVALVAVRSSYSVFIASKNLQGDNFRYN